MRSLCVIVGCHMTGGCARFVTPSYTPPHFSTPFQPPLNQAPYTENSPHTPPNTANVQQSPNWRAQNNECDQRPQSNLCYTCGKTPHSQELPNSLKRKGSRPPAPPRSANKCTNQPPWRAHRKLDGNHSSKVLLSGCWKKSGSTELVIWLNSTSLTPNSFLFSLTSAAISDSACCRWEICPIHSPPL